MSQTQVLEYRRIEPPRRGGWIPLDDAREIPRFLIVVGAFVIVTAVMAVASVGAASVGIVW